MRHLLLILVGLLASGDVLAMRCGNDLVTIGAKDFQVQARCGEPFWTDHYTNVEIIGARGPVERQRSVQFDVWYYNFGPRNFIRALLFRDGILQREETLGYGVDVIGQACNPRQLFGGLSVGELVARCGEPVTRRDRSEVLATRPRPGVELWRDQRREDWIYDFGEPRLRVLQLIDGRVSGVETPRR